MKDSCIRCQEDTMATDVNGFAFCPKCYGRQRAEDVTVIRNFELYLECWAAYRRWEEAHPVVARVIAYTERDR